MSPLLSHAIKYGTGQAVIKPYVYFNMLTGKGERGNISIAVEDDLSGGGFLQPVQTADKRTFAGTGRADDSDHFTFVEIDVNAV